MAAIIQFVLSGLAGMTGTAGTGLGVTALERLIHFKDAIIDCSSDTTSHQMLFF